MNIQFNRSYLLLTVLLFVIEICIALFVKDHFVRPYLGDFLVVILIYCFVRSFFDFPVIKTAMAVLFFSYAVELLQYIEMVKWMGLQHSTFARVIIGTSFAWEDIVAYTAGIMFVILWEMKLMKTKKQPAQKND